MDSLLEYRNCPSCGRNDFTVLFDSNMNKGDLQQGIESVYMLPGGKYGRHVKCRHCELVYVNPIEKASKINEDYSMRKSADVSIIRRGRLRATKSQAQLVKKYNNSTSLLDVGCGEGFFLFSASEAGYITKGVELSEEAAAYARREFGLDIEAKPFEQLRFPEDYFDVVTLWQVLEHLPHPLAILKEVNKILKPGGLLAVSTPDIEGIPARLLGKRWWNIRKIHINQFTTKTLKAILENAGFKNVSSACYRESISLLMLLMPVLRSPKLHKPLRGLLCPGSILGRAMDKIMLAYPSRLDNTTMIAFK